MYQQSLKIIFVCPNWNKPDDLKQSGRIGFSFSIFFSRFRDKSESIQNGSIGPSAGTEMAPLLSFTLREYKEFPHNVEN